MALSNHTSRVYLDEVDLWGAINVLSKRIKEGTDPKVSLVYYGALLALHLMYTQKRIENQAVFLRLLDVQLFEVGLLNSLEESNA